ncbi:UNVERIFIED_CONTAM: hypothetical protein FKN15_071624 [Acipenser sinensis]
MVMEHYILAFGGIIAIPLILASHQQLSNTITVSLIERHKNKPELDLLYAINDRPPWYLCISFGFQHYILAFGGIIAIPLILAEPMCFGDNDSVKSQLISTIFLVLGLCTLLQTTFGTRLPILQGGTFSFITPTLAILALPEWRCPDIKEMLVNTTNNTEFNRDEIWKSCMRECTESSHQQLSNTITVSLNERHKNKPELDLLYAINDRPPWYLCISFGFQHYILAFGGIIAIPLILAEPMCFGDNDSVKSQLISTIFLVSGLCTLLQTTFGTRLPILQGGTFSFITPTLAILALPEWRCPDIKEMLVNTTNNTEFNRDEIWKSCMREVGSRLLLQYADLLMIFLGLFGKFGAIFITIPIPVIGGMFMVMFGMIAAVGISNLQYVYLNSSRNLLILGFSTFSGLVLPTWFHSNPEMINTGIVHTYCKIG